ncbi:MULTISPECIES: TetR/AcrR family transcriptional regulator [unclassified Rhizobium]|jgi:AcrR family transcriptional regulator|uniref:TetR/AcrR family transcriptional regulator n=1 Tax=unclassified Rhizobium TaxID=2613769 RepID=UPI0006454B4C|nr:MULTISPECIES: TetR/AcrR family transcriptional regulator [unclassified Rhizobium]MBN8950579.1 TetR/AcrR family transcriptional regulator [Rhizobium tropici]OJY66132.1 MAG: TetR family transcriptional regulator [Rhizobium sp. 60-20]RKD69323.1 TetR family transcriptional regulator [Rhizobium sp. WW_1]
MPQKLKDDVRDRIVAAAGAVFAEKGFAAARLADVAERADISTGNIYKYFRDKEALFNTVVTPPVAAELLRKLRARLKEFPKIKDWEGATAAGSGAAGALLSFWIDHRVAVLILLRGSQGTRFEHVRGLMINEMERLASSYVERRAGGSALSPASRFVLHKVFARTVDMIADILDAHQDPQSIQQAVTAFWRYQLAGLQALLNV